MILTAGKKNQVNNLLPFDKIHQISSVLCNDQNYKVACSAGREILLTEIVDNEFGRSFIVHMSDWISSIRILDEKSVVVLTAHNMVAMLEVDEGKAVVKEKLRCDENSTLYCSLIHGTLWSDLTFFGEISLLSGMFYVALCVGSVHIVHKAICI